MNRKSVYDGLYNDIQGRINAQMETLTSLLDGHSQAEKIKDTDVLTVQTVEQKLAELIEMLGGYEALR